MKPEPSMPMPTTSRHGISSPAFGRADRGGDGVGPGLARPEVVDDRLRLRSPRSGSTPSAMTSSSASSVRTPPAALTPMCGEVLARISRRSSWVAPARGEARRRLDEVGAGRLGQAARADLLVVGQVGVLEDHLDDRARRHGRPRRPPRCPAWTSPSRPDLSAPIWMTMSSSVAPSARARRASATLVSVVWPPCGNPIDRPDRDVRAVEDGRRAARRRPVGRRRSRRRTRPPAGSRPRRTRRRARAGAASGRSSSRCRVR